MMTDVSRSPRSPRTFSEAWTAARAADPTRTLLVDTRDGSAFTVEELDLLMRRALAWLEATGLRPGDRFALLASPEIEHLILVHAAMWAGIVPVLLHPETPPARLGEAVRATGARAWMRREHSAADPDALVLGEALLEALATLEPAPPPAPPPAEAEAAILFSSGSTGPAKGVIHSQASLVEGVRRLARPHGVRVGQRHGIGSLLHTITGVRLALLAPALDGTVAVLFDAEASAAGILAACAEGEVEVLHTGMRLVRALNTAPERMRPLLPPSLRAVVAGGGGLSLEERLCFARAFALTLWNTYGATETAGTVASARTEPDGPAEPGVGRPLVPVRVVDAEGRELPSGALGELLLAPDPPMIGYVHGGGLEEDGRRRWVRPGDLGLLDAEGFLHVRGRAQRLHVRQCGEKVLLDELEALVRAVAGVDAIVVAVELPRREDRIAALVELEAMSDAWLGRVQAALGERLPAHAIPSFWHALPALPRNQGGKPDLRAATELLGALLSEAECA